jgi:hypothetical protein
MLAGCAALALISSVAPVDAVLAAQPILAPTPQTFQLRTQVVADRHSLSTSSDGASEINWQTDASASTTQSMQLLLSNSGSSAATWTAHTDVPWLTISPSSGTLDPNGQPVVLTVTGPPEGLMPNARHTARITIMRTPGHPGDAPEIHDIDVNFDIAGASTGANLQRPIFMPLVGR